MRDRQVLGHHVRQRVDVRRRVRPPPAVARLPFPADDGQHP
ncbi:MAG: hypothetical protein U5P41_07250 [Gammaproteobacteria bacterium]|nr:hypothetical protein [Gammaproteobacteria bacterium]